MLVFTPTRGFTFCQNVGLYPNARIPYDVDQGLPGVAQYLSSNSVVLWPTPDGHVVHLSLCAFANESEPKALAC